MSRSRRHIPITGNTKAESDKCDKVRGNRRARRSIRVALIRLDDPLPNHREIYNVYDLSKDGKQYFDPSEHPKLMRK